MMSEDPATLSTYSKPKQGLEVVSWVISYGYTSLRGSSIYDPSYYILSTFKY